ncbi:coat protein [Beauveria bassiana victorivirus NZL/1980]|uniref:Coat protein n=1 Tax=Beauveria bassiana victorivirus NZL/1980 TaxID=1485922 RepID=A0A059XJB5_9VIRU|nr:coat protein [Beauveria bassiana victorivirus NZL/1980]AIA22671.1 coat protein [Beauveria bassiana victorivirus NZL/1980]
MATTVRNSLLASVISTPRGGALDAGTTFRRYRSNCRTSTTIGGNEDARIAQITYEVGRVHNTKGQALAQTGERTVAIETAYDTSAVLAEDFVGLAKKFTNFSASFGSSSLAAIVERLGKCIAAQSVYGDVTSTDLRAGRALTVNALSTYDGPVNSLANTVFVPRLVNSVITGDVFSVLANAVAGEGSSVATDVIELDATTRQPIIPFVDSDGIFRARVDALRILGANMIACDQGPLFAYALTRGIHRVVSVVAHTDEGGITRDLLRSSAFAAPFGGIHYGLTPYSGLPAIASNNGCDLASYVDSIALITAGLVSHCDPGITHNGYWFPTFFSGTSVADIEGRPGDELPGTPAMSHRIHAQLATSIGAFAPAYIAGLGRVFAADGQTDRAVSHMCAAVTLMNGDNRHLRYPSVAPFFWIEPTSLIPHDLLGSQAEACGAGSFGTRDTVRSRDLFEDLVSVGSPDTTFTAYHALMRFPRTSWLFLHWLGHPANGLGAIPVRQLDPNAIVHPGGCVAHQPVRDRVEASLPFTDYLWVRGQSPFPAPGEMLNLAGTVGFLVKHLTFDDEGLPTPEHVPTAREFLTSEVTIHVGRPMGLTSGPSNARDSTVRRAKTRAARELSAATARLKLYGRADVAEMPTLTTAPVMRSVAPPPFEVDRHGTPGGASGWTRAANAGGEVAHDAIRQPDGEQRPAVPHYQPVRYPQVARAGPGGGGGAGGAIPPGPPPGPPPGGDDDDHDPQAPLAPAPGILGVPPPNGATN